MKALAVVLVAGALALGCQQPAAKPASRARFATVATVNGVALTQLDLDAALAATGGGHQAAEPSNDRREKALRGLIHDELVRQKAAALGLLPGPQHAEELARIEARLSAAQRRAMADAFFNHEVQDKVVVTDAEAEEVFRTNAAQLRTELRLNQMLFRDEASALRATAALEAGEPFEQFAKRQFPDLPEAAGRPWELGFLSWRQMPSAWRSVLFDLKPGQTTGVVRGPNQRFWVLQVVERRENPALTFADVKADLVAELRAARIEALAASADQALRAAAKITIEPQVPSIAEAPGAP